MSTESEAQIVSRDQREKYERDGYLVIDASFPAAVLDGIVADLDGLYGGKERLEAGVIYYRNRILNAWRISTNVKALAQTPKILRILKELYGRDPLPFQTINFRTGTEQHAHSDTIHFNSMPPGYMCGVWVALEDMDMDNGPLVYYRGSHRLPEITMQDAGAPADWSGYERYERFIADLITREQVEPQYATIRKGQAFLWSSNLLHGGSIQKDKSRSRHSQVTHYFFEGCKYYTPALTDGEEVHWTAPEWIA